jgi:hypothetical protein
MTGREFAAVEAVPGAAVGAPVAMTAVDRLLHVDRPGSRRTAVRLLRVALESAVDDLWRSIDRPTLCGVSRRAQFLVLPQILDVSTARHTAAVWGSLSAAGHHHAYELTPTAVELAGWRTDTDRCLTELADPGRRRPMHAPR